MKPQYDTLTRRFVSARHWLIVGVVFFLTMELYHSPVDAQTFSSGSDESDGELSFPNAQPGDTIVFNPASFVPPLDQDGDGVYHFTTITIPAGVTVELRANLLGVAPVIWLASGGVQILGILDLSGEDGNPGMEPSGVQVPAVAGAGGYNGGVGGTTTGIPGTPGDGPRGGGGGLSNSGGGGAGHTAAGGDGGVHSSTPSAPPGNGGTAYGNDFLFPLTGGSGGGGGGLGGGGAGGGALLIASSTSIVVDGTITAAGGNGGAFNGFSNGGGGGSGGAIRLLAPTLGGTGTLDAGGGVAFDLGGAGSTGRVRLEAFQHLFSGSVDPPPNVVTPGLVFLPSTAPSVRVVSIGGVAVPLTPTGSFIAADVTLADVSTVTLNIEARNIPLGTIVQLTLMRESGSAVTVNSTPLAGATPALSTATAEATIPHGFSRFRVEATWTP